MDALIEKAEKDSAEDLLYLYDGPPISIPYGVKMVCFTSLNERWFDTIEKSDDCPLLIMPPWDLEELVIACGALNLTTFVAVPDEGEEDVAFADNTGNADMVVDHVEERFKIFGGAARECLSIDPTFIEKRQEHIKKTIMGLEDIDFMKRVLNQSNSMLHCICHFVPNPANPLLEYSVAEPTTFEKRLLAECLNKLNTAKRNEILDCLRHNISAAPFRGALFGQGSEIK
ncbi:hypothetical protein PHYSODRAFT_328438 [Phytophthora sojae]|uniref:Uncharacterized protein n=1 Tax=Phytophthora sojae (strain P6497) TaxID=1094619 RepID=G4Z6P4_PHYSP|nr:hypothetical protein PHYSODRAFT_328438 [Phytophthora sojae]EGZ20310.1 hypothetical protein PHYSODRAFT_328438 [Phytophthora sojae]|eukprot:XP_009523027.1 hypothetical protein PHYSODRAFT_328438 [Phytophthora sojae]